MSGMLKAYGGQGGAPAAPGGGNLTGGGPKHGGTFSDNALEGLGRGSRVWYFTEGSWVGGSIVSLGGEVCQLKSDKTGGLVDIPAKAVQPANPDVLEGVNDLTQLSYLNEPSILFNLGVRYTADQIYTRAGPVLVAINPFRKVPLYTPAIMESYVNSVGAADGMREPHIFLIADNAYRSMVKEGENQSIIVSGESGAGKTETTKYAMQYVARLAGGTGVEDRVLETNPILETFGNAKTLRNNNSSRFGKLIDIFFTPTGKIAGANIQTYLLEKSRVIKRTPGERSYHIFYQLCAGAGEEERRALQLRPADQYEYLAHSECYTIPGVDDEKDFQELCTAMGDLGITAEEQREIFGLLSAVLWLGNVHFAVGADEAVKVERGEALTAAAALLHVRGASLELALTQRKIAAGKEIVTQPLKYEQAVDSRDALAKAIYSSIFDWVVEKINAALDVHRGKAARANTTSISILDIYGFECFHRNGFEQLCINYANERLQQQFNIHLFKLEQEEYSREKIDWAHIDFEDNQECVDLIEKKPLGVLSLLDEQCRFPKATDTTFAAKLAEHLAANKHFSKNVRLPTGFDIAHYAGSVNYDATGFLDKNKDVLYADLISLMGRSTCGMMRDFASNVDAAARGKQVAGARGGASQNQSVGSRFKDQLSALMQRLDATQPHFVRCIKPNDRQAPNSPDPDLMLHQLKCCGVLEVVRIACQGYPTRYAHELFCERYQFLLPEVMQTQGSPLERARDIIRFFRLDTGLYQVGLTKLFFRAGTVGQIEDMRTRTLSSVITIQKEGRRLICRLRFTRLRAASVCVGRHFRGHRARVEYAELKRQWYAAVAVQRMYKGHVRRAEYKRDRHYIVLVQLAARRWLLGHRVRARERERRRQEKDARRREEKEAERRKYDRAAREEYELEQAEKAALERAMAVAGGAAAGGGGAAPGAAAGGVGTLPAGGRKAHVEALEGLTARVGSLEAEKAALAATLREEQERTDFFARMMAEWEETLGAQVEGVSEQLATARGLLSGDVELAPGGEDPPSPGQAAAAQQRRDEETKDASAAILQGLTQEFEHRSRVFDDDSEFLWEVKAGKEVADLDPETELINLRNRFEFWKKDFKVRLKDTKDLLKKIDKDRQRQQTLIQSNYYANKPGEGGGAGGSREGVGGGAGASPEDKKKKGFLGKLGFSRNK